MAPRPAWKGYLKLSLVTCAVELSNATTATEKVSFRILNRATGNTVKRQYVDAETGKPVGDDDEVKGYETGERRIPPDRGGRDRGGPDRILAHAQSRQLRRQSPRSTQIYLDTPYYLAPADKVSEEAFAVIRDAHGREEDGWPGAHRALPARAAGGHRAARQGHAADDAALRQARCASRTAIFGDIKTVKTDQEMIELASHIIDRRRPNSIPRNSRTNMRMRCSS